MNRRLLIAFCLGMAILPPARLAAWHKHGHMAVARIAWTQLEEKDKVALSKILAAHPHFQIYLQAGRPKAMPEVDWVFVRAATWPDWVRDPRAPGLNLDDKHAI